MDIQTAFIFLGSAASKVSKFDWRRLIPRFKVDHYKYGAGGIEFTWRVGPGVGLGLGVVDLWFGWPRLEENLHTEECRHPRIATPVES